MKIDTLNLLLLLSIPTSFIFIGFSLQNLIKIPIFTSLLLVPSQKSKYFCSALFSITFSLLTLTVQDLLNLCTIIYIGPFYLGLDLQSSVQLCFANLILWFVIGGFLHRGQTECVVLIGTIIITLIQVSQNTSFENLQDKCKGLSIKNQYLQDKVNELEKKLSVFELPNYPRVSTRLAEKLKKIGAIHPQITKFCSDSSDIESCSDPEIEFHSSTSDITCFHLNTSSSNNSSTLSSPGKKTFNFNEEIKEAITSLISKEYLIWNPNSAIDLEKDLTMFGSNAKNLYTQNIESLPGGSQRRISPRKKRVPKIIQSVIEESENLGKILEFIEDWDFDTFKLLGITYNPAFEVGRYVFDTLGLVERFEIENAVLQHFLTDVEAGYSKQNFYHNSLHAADVTASIVFLVHQGLGMCGSLVDVEIFALVVAALCHDIGHPGVNNAYLIANRDPLALRYNDQSVLEHMHAAKVFRILSQAATNIVKMLSKPDFQKFRKIVILSILSTDLQVHFDKLGEFKVQVSNKKTLDDDKFRMQALQICLKCADIGHGAKILDIHKKWTNLITKEFFKQGDMERSQGLAISPLCDRENVVISKSQDGFLKILVKPLFETWEDFIRQNNEENEELAVFVCMRNITQNIEFWENEYQKYKDGEKVFEIDDSLAPLLYK